MEEKFTILKEDLATNAAFFNKLDQALREVSNWNRDPFERRTMLEVRNLFETDISCLRARSNRVIWKFNSDGFDFHSR